MFTYQKTGRFFAQVANGIEELAAAELEGLGALECSPAYRGLYFSGDRETLYRVNYESRLSSRILAPLLRFDCHSTKYLYKTARGIRWQEFLSADQTFAVNATVSHSRIKHSKYAALCLKDAVADSFRELCGRRPDVDTSAPDLLLNLHVENNKATISIDTSGRSLHRRGYRKQSVAAPMQETLAAAIIRLSGWDGSVPLMDPFCGSGTLLCEALMQYCRIPAGYLNPNFGFACMPDYDKAAWDAVRNTADAAIRRLPPDLITGSDASGEAAAAARENCALLPDGKRIVVKKASFADLKPGFAGVIVCNPPHGIRLREETDMDGLYKDIGDFLKQNCTGSTAFLYMGKPELAKRVGLKPAWKKTLYNGGQAGILAKYELY